MNDKRLFTSLVSLAAINTVLVAVGVALMPSIALAVVWALCALTLHLASMVYLAARELGREFGAHQEWVARFERQMLDDK
jgi:hypothetical protein